MTHDLSIKRPGAGEGPPAVAPLAWSSFGLPGYWLEQRLRPVCERYAQALKPGVPPGASGALERGEGEWDLLFVAVPGDGLDPSSAFETALSRLTLIRPLDCVIAVGAESTLKRQLAFMRAGAFDVLTLSGPASQLERAVERAVTILQARHKRRESDTMKLINQLAVSVNHEINNPLTGLIGTAELMLLDSRELDDKFRRDIQTIIGQARRIQEVTARLKLLNQLRSIPYGTHDQMLDLGLHQEPPALVGAGPAPVDLFHPVPRLLVVDDNPLIIDLIARLFEHRYAIAAASDAHEALAHIEHDPPYDLVLIDLIMPEMNGLDLFRAIRRLRPGQKALLTTAYDGDPRVEQAIAEGALGCVFKPFQLEDIEAAINDALGRKDA